MDELLIVGDKNIEIGIYNILWIILVIYIFL